MSAMQSTSTPTTIYLAAVVDLLGALAYGELRPSPSSPGDSELAPTLGTSRAGAASQHMRWRTSGCSASARAARRRPRGSDGAVRDAVDAFHERTAASDWLEGLVKAYVGDGIAQDFYREIAELRRRGHPGAGPWVLEDTGQAEFAVAVVREAIDEDPRLSVGSRSGAAARRRGDHPGPAGRGRARRPGRPARRRAGRAGADLAELGRMFVRLTDEHTRRMERLGLSA